MHNTVKHLLIGVLVMSGATSCSTLKKSSTNKSGSNTSASTATPQNKPANPPKFIENISINSGDFSSHTHESPYLPGLVSGPAELEFASPIAFKYAILLDAPVETIRDAKLFDFIESWYGTRYRYGGNDRTGIDCSAFVQTFVSNQYNLSVPRTSASQYENSKRISKDELQEGDLVFFKTLGRRKGISHVGVYLRNNKFLHASTSSGVIINDMNDTYYATHYAGAGRIR